MQLDRLEQLVEIGLLGCRDFDVLHFAAHLLDDDLVLEQFLADLLRLGLRLIDLVDRDDHRHAGGAGVIDRFDALRAQAVIGRGDQRAPVRSEGHPVNRRLVATQSKELRAGLEIPHLD